MVFLNGNALAKADAQTSARVTKLQPKADLAMGVTQKWTCTKFYTLGFYLQDGFQR
jgi:hypothetical protein